VLNTQISTQSFYFEFLIKY